MRRPRPALIRAVACYGVMVAGTAFALSWLQYQHLVRVFPTEAYAVLLAVGFLVLGVWVGRRATPARPVAEGFRCNRAALDTLGISDREYQALSLLADGLSNKQIARSMGVSPNTVKTHLRHLYGKLDVSRRTEAVGRARSLSLIP